MKAVLTGFALLGLVACAAPAPVLNTVEVFRNPTAQIASQTNVTAARMAGDWVIRQSFAGATGPQGTMSLMELPDGALQWTFPRESCLNDVCNREDVLVLLEPTGPGRWAPSDPQAAGFGAELWVMWMDFDDRTAAIGTPDGQFGFILDKSSNGGGDRITAARDIMEWFGYNMALLKEVST